MKKCLPSLLMFVALCAHFTAFSQNTFSKVVKGSAYNFSQAWKIRQLPDSGFFYVGYGSAVSGGNEELLATRTDKNFDTLWQRSLSKGSTMHLSGFTGVPIDNGYFIAGRHQPNPGSSSFVNFIKLNLAGQTVWAKSSTSSSDNEPISSIYTLDKHLMTSGTYNNLFYILKMDTNGVIKWGRSFSGAEKASCVVQASDSSYYVSGGTPSTFAALFHFDKNGTILWADSLPAYEATAVVANPSGGCYVTGTCWLGGLRGFMAKFNATGNLQWINAYDPGTPLMPKTIALSTSKNLIVAGRASGDGFILVADSNGNFKSAYRYGGNNWDDLHSVIWTKEGYIVASGVVENFNYGPFYTSFLVKADSTGNSGCLSTPLTLTVSPLSGSAIPFSATYTNYGPALSNASYAVGAATQQADPCATTGSDELNPITTTLTPNPTNGKVTFLSSEIMFSIEIINGSGRVVNEYLIKDKIQETSIDITGLPRGVYFAKIRLQNRVEIRKIVLH